MKLRGWHIDGFGIFHDHAVVELPDGLTILHGPNEAGKSTLLAFLRGVLFGFPDRRRRLPRYPPLRGGQHGGQLQIEDATGRFTVARTTGRRQSLDITRPDGEAGTAADLQQLLGSADETLFNNIFAFSLTELQSFESLSQAGVRERIFSAGIAGAGRSARAAVSTLEKRRAELLRRRGKCRFAELQGKLQKVNQEIQTGKRAAAEYAELSAAEQRATQRVQELWQEIESQGNRHDHLQRLLELWPTWHEHQEAEQALAEFAATPLGEATATATAAAIELSTRLDRDLHLYREQLAEISEARLSCEQAESELARQLDELGPDWDAARIAAGDFSIARRQEIRRHQEQLQEAGAATEKATTALRQASELSADGARTADQLRRRCRTISPDDAPVSERPELDARLNALNRLRANRAELGQRQHRLADQQATGLDRHRSRRLHENTTAWLPPAALDRVAGLIAAAALVWLVIGLLRHAPDWWTIILAGGALLALWLLRMQRHRTARHEQQRRENLASLETEMQALAGSQTALKKEIDALTSAIADDVGLLALSPEPSAQEIDDCALSLTNRREARRTLDELNAQLAEIEQQLADSDERIQQLTTRQAETRAHHTQLLEEWQAWLATMELAADLTPIQALDLFDVVHRCRETLHQHAKLDGRVAHLQAAIDEWEEPAGTLTTDLTGPTLIDRYVTWRDALARRAELQQQLETFDRSITRQIGEGPAAAALSAELATGQAETWRQEEAATKNRLNELQQLHHAAIAAQNDAQRDREQLEQSADIAGHEIERTVLIEQLTATIDEWRVASLASGLIEDTRREFERTRQPAVMTSASRLFADVTAGRYTQLVREDGDAGLAILDSRQRRRQIEELSRGTAEQLYLCLRLGLAAEFAQRSTELPLVMDDVLVNFDPDRARRMAEVLADFTHEHQVLLFTCHPGTRDLLRDTDPDALVIELEHGSEETNAGQQRLSV